ncbi:hypothetical protein PaG_03589 [Moesziomyces aphidis]|uniref:Uncharacterized protein n=1 Tax=Moesziomyces aphidis TaxID=84754 RepID=W3VK44_MOEAP|nr:hypothetical protein PaG_03589 [Moesziomyces aphidis]
MGGASMSASLLGLKAELERTRASAAAPRRTSSSKPPKVAAKARSLHSPPRDDEVSHNQVRRSLERKARTYAQLSSGKYAGVSQAALLESSIDWTRKVHEHQSSSPPESADHDADPMVEYIDEFGRTRVSHLSEIPRHLLPREEKEEEEDGTVIYGPAQSFPVYTPAPRVAAKKFDARQEMRYRGAAFYRFSTDQLQRERQMNELAQQHSHTQAIRSTTQRKGGTSLLKTRLAQRAHKVHDERLRILGPAAVHQRSQRIQQARLAALLPST